MRGKNVQFLCAGGNIIEDDKVTLNKRSKGALCVDVLIG